MKRRLALLLAITAVASRLFAAEPSDGVRKAAAGWRQGAVNQDEALLQRYLADDLVYTHGGGKTQSKAEYIADVTTGPSHYESFTESDTRIRIYGRTAVLTGFVDVKPANGALYRVRTFEVYTLSAGGDWQLAQKESVRPSAATPAAQDARRLDLRGDRFKPLTWEQLTPEQRTMVNDLLSGSRTSLGGPFNALLRSPEMGNLAQKLGEYIRFRTSVPRRLNEMAILLTARWWSSQYEWHAHKPLALEAGLPATVIDDIQAGRRPSGMRSDEEVVYDFATELRERRRVSDAAFDRAVKLLGEKGAVDLIAAMGYYDLVSMILNVDRYPLPAGASAPFTEPK